MRPVTGSSTPNGCCVAVAACTVTSCSLEIVGRYEATQLELLIFVLLYLVVLEIGLEFVPVHWLPCLHLFRKVLVCEYGMFGLLILW